MTAARMLLAFVIMVGRAHGADRVRVAVFGLFHPRELTVEVASSQPLLVSAGDQRFALDDRQSRMSIASAGENTSIRVGDRRVIASQVNIRGQHADSTELVLSVPGKLRRRFCGELTIISRRGELLPVVAMELEIAVASVVAAELPTDETPFEALKAQAVVARSYLLASPPRHEAAAFCDTTHCQFLRQPPPENSAAARATAATRALVLAWKGKPFPAMYSGSCTGRTRSLAEIGVAQRDYPYFGVACPYCRYTEARSAAGGHGLGLCQRGAAGMARDGADFRAILQHYFPNTTVECR